MVDIIITQERISKRVAELGREISEYFRGRPLTAVAVLNGAMLFASDLVRCMALPDMRLDTIGVSSYKGSASTGVVNFRVECKMPVAGRSVLIIDDVLDSGDTMAALVRHFTESGAAEVKTCVLLDKHMRRDKTAFADWVGFDAPNRFIVGYGLDFDERYRQLPYVAVL